MGREERQALLHVRLRRDHPRLDLLSDNYIGRLGLGSHVGLRRGHLRQY